MTRSAAIFLLCHLAATSLPLSINACLRNAIGQAPYQHRFVIVIIGIVADYYTPPKIFLFRLAGRLIHNIRIGDSIPLLLVLESLDFIIKDRIYIHFSVYVYKRMRATHQL